VSADFGLTDRLLANVGLDAVDAQLKDGTPLPRIPPYRARVGVDYRYKNFSLRPGVVMVKDQDQIFPTETRTAGYALFDFSGSYTLARTHVAHVFALNSFNLGDRVYRNHLSFIKDLAPELGRGVRFTYTVRFF
jgi:iron complex outermembrane receptor protein